MGLAPVFVPMFLNLPSHVWRPRGLVSRRHPDGAAGVGRAGGHPADAVHRALAGRAMGGEALLRALTRLHQHAVALRARLRGRPRPVHRPEARTDGNRHASGSAVSIETDKQAEQALRFPLSLVSREE